MKQIIITTIFLIASFSTFAADTYRCSLNGEFTNSDNKTVSIYMNNLLIKVGPEAVQIGKTDPAQSESDWWPEIQMWTISLDVQRDGGETPLVLTVSAPNQNAAIGRAYAQKGAKYIGFILGSHFEALCIKK